MNKPLQRVMNASFAAESGRFRFAGLAITTPAEGLSKPVLRGRHRGPERASGEVLDPSASVRSCRGRDSGLLLRAARRLDAQRRACARRRPRVQAQAQAP